LQLEEGHANIGPAGTNVLTYPDEKAVKRIDYIFVSKGGFEKDSKQRSE
jgi:endonuclease/exonuclease/phosphatase family metal-dependent hydrolase